MKTFTSLFLVILLGACTPKPKLALKHDAYIWQRHWTPALANAVKESQDWFSHYRVLAGQWMRDGNHVKVNPDFHLLQSIGKKIVAVFRFEGQLESLDATQANLIILSTLKQWQDAGLAVTGIEIDHDCATSNLANYGNFLRELKTQFPKNAILSITTLPTWLGSPEFAALVDEVDEWVLQVHAVENPKQGLFSADRAKTWIHSLKQKTHKPFWVALPAYGSRVVWDEQDRLIAVESEARVDIQGTKSTELYAEPAQVVNLLHWLEKNAPANLLGIVWFRLPTAQDERAWSLPTLHAVIAGTPLVSRIQPRLLATTTPGLFDVAWTNEGDIDAMVPTSLSTSGSNCQADAINGYTLVKKRQNLQWDRLSPLRLHAHQHVIIGWLRCPVDTKVEFHGDS